MRAPALPLAGCVASGQFRSLSGPPFPPLQRGTRSSPGWAGAEINWKHLAEPGPGSARPWAECCHCQCRQRRLPSSSVHVLVSPLWTGHVRDTSKGGTPALRCTDCSSCSPGRPGTAPGVLPRAFLSRSEHTLAATGQAASHPPAPPTEPREAPAGRTAGSYCCSLDTGRRPRLGCGSQRQRELAFLWLS